MNLRTGYADNRGHPNSQTITPFKFHIYMHMNFLRANDDTFCKQPLFCVIEMVYKISTCNETVTELLLVLVGLCGGAGMKLTIALLASLGPSIMVKLDRDSCAEGGISMTFKGATILKSVTISLV